LLDRGRQAIFLPELRDSVEKIVEDVASNGDEAVCRATLEWDGCELEPDRLRVSEGEIEEGAAHLPPDLRDALRVGIDHVRRFSEQVLERAASWRTELDPGLTVGEQRSPITSAGLFVPSGKGSYPSVLVQIGTPAVVAGVPDITVTMPPKDERGGVDPAVLFVAKELGLHQVFRANGPAGVAAMALGTERFAKAWKVLGPGSPPVAASQVECQRRGCSTVLLLGPSESLILADESADPKLLAADLLNEAEHGPDSACVLVTPSPSLVEAVQGELATQLAVLPEPRASYATAALGTNGGAVVVEDIAEAVDVANQYLGDTR
jgi:histidinol dehydrogenase